MPELNLLLDEMFNHSHAVPDAQRYKWDSYQVDHGVVAEWLETASTHDSYSDDYINAVVAWMNMCDDNVTDLDNAVFMFGCVGEVEGYELPADEAVINRWLRIPSIIHSPLSCYLAERTKDPQALLLLADSRFAGYDRYAMEATIGLIVKSAFATDEVIFKALETYARLGWSDLRVPLFAALHPSMSDEKRSELASHIAGLVNAMCEGQCDECEERLFYHDDCYIDTYNSIPDYLDEDSEEMANLYEMIAQETPCEVFKKWSN